MAVDRSKVLDIINRARAGAGYCRQHNLMPGVRGDMRDCVIARALKDAYPGIRVQQTRIELAHCHAMRLGAALGVKPVPSKLSPRRSQIIFTGELQALEDFIAPFDEGEMEDLIDADAELAKAQKAKLTQKLPGMAKLKELVGA